MTRCGAGRTPQPGAGEHGVATIPVAPGHMIDLRGTHEKLAALSRLSMPDVLIEVNNAWENVREYADSVNLDHFHNDDVFSRYEAASTRKDWEEADRLFLDSLVLDPPKYRRLLGVERTMRAFAPWLCGIALESEYAYRWIDPPELESCLGGTFESRIEHDGTRRGFKALSVNPELQFGKRKIRIRVPMNDAIRRNIWCVRYTAMPRKIEEEDERIGDPKSAKYVAEAEIRVPDGTPIPSESDFAVMSDAKIGEDLTKDLGAGYRAVKFYD